MGPKTYYSHMSQLLRPGEKGLFIFTDGEYFDINKRNGYGYTGWWKLDLRRRADWVFIYYTGTRPYTNELYMARWGNLRGPNQDGNYLINLREAKQVGCTDTKWVEFGGGAGRGIRYFP
jgi:hypothetical protein